MCVHMGVDTRFYEKKVLFKVAINLLNSSQLVSSTVLPTVSTMMYLVYVPLNFGVNDLKT